jgi:hypothetical protein
MSAASVFGCAGWPYHCTERKPQACRPNADGDVRAPVRCARPCQKHHPARRQHHDHGIRIWQGRFRTATLQHHRDRRQRQQQQQAKLPRRARTHLIMHRTINLHTERKACYLRRSARQNGSLGRLQLSVGLGLRVCGGEKLLNFLSDIASIVTSESLTYWGEIYMMRALCLQGPTSIAWTLPAVVEN